MSDIDIRLGKWQERLADVPDASVRLILTSPPYDNARTYEGTNEPVDFGELAAFALRVLVPGGVLAMVLDGAVNDGTQSVTPYRVICEWAALPGWRLLQVLAYGRQGQPGRYEGRFRKDHEPLIVMVRDGARHVCCKDRIAARARWGRPGGPVRIRKRDGGQLGETSTDPTAWDTCHRGSIWDYECGHHQDRSADTEHPATFAEDFALDAVKVWSNPGDLVCDPFSGSGTVAVACRGLGRRFVGAERVGPCPDCGGGFPERCGCPRNHLDYYNGSLHRLDRYHVTSASVAQPVGPLFAGGAAR